MRSNLWKRGWLYGYVDAVWISRVFRITMTAEGKQTFSFRGGDLKKGKYMRITREIALGGWRMLVFQGPSLTDESIKESDTDED